MKKFLEWVETWLPTAWAIIVSTLITVMLIWAVVYIGISVLGMLGVM